MKIIKLVQSNTSKNDFFSDCLEPLDKVLQDKIPIDAHWAYTNYFYLFQIKGKEEEFLSKTESTIFTIRKPGCTLGYIELDSELKIVDAKYYTDETTQRVIEIEKLEKNNQLVKSLIGKKVEIVAKGKTITTEKELLENFK